MYPFVVATAISGPAYVYMHTAASRAIVEPTAFTIARVSAPFSFAILRAARVSAVSPDCDTNITSVVGVIS